MESKANTVLIGGFTLAVLAALFSFLYWFMRGGEGGNRTEYRIAFSGSVGGLRTGANVFFNGIRVGEVRAVALDPSDARRVIATVMVRNGTPIDANTRATLDVQLLSGAASLALFAGAPGAPPLVAGAAGSPIIQADPSGVQDVLASVSRVMGTIEATARRLDDALAEGQGPFNRSLANVERFTQSLGRNADGVSDFLGSVGEASRQITALTQRLERVTGQIETALQGVEPGRVASILRNVEALTGGPAGAQANLGDLLRDARTAVNSFDRIAQAFDVQALNRAFGNIDRLSAALDSDRLTRVVENVDRFTRALGDNSPQVDRMLKDAAELATRLTGMANRIDGLVRGVSGEGDNTMFGEFTQTARSVRVLAERLDQRTATLTNAINGFTDRTLREFQTLSADGRRTLTELERTLRSLERNPQRFIFGGSGQPEFNRR